MESRYPDGGKVLFAPLASSVFSFFFIIVACFSNIFDMYEYSHGNKLVCGLECFLKEEWSRVTSVDEGRSLKLLLYHQQTYKSDELLIAVLRHLLPPLRPVVLRFPPYDRPDNDHLRPPGGSGNMFF